MSDPHIRILRQVARQRQRDLDDRDAADHLGDPASTARRQDLARTATRTRARVAASQARRRYAGQTAGSDRARDSRRPAQRSTRLPRNSADVNDWIFFDPRDRG